jgi:acyl-CoA synthetase (AMP-forming)/AMP-acid ligase II
LSTADSAQSFTISDAVRTHARRTPDAVAIVCEATRSTWSQLDNRVNVLAAALRSDGVGVGERILWWGQNCHRLLELLCAASRLGATVCPVNWRQSTRELGFVIDDCTPRVVVWQDREIGSTIRDFMTPERSDIVWIQHDGSGDGSYEHYLGTCEQPEFSPTEEHEDLPVLMMYTAAFSGTPNGALLSGRALMSQSMTIRLLEQLDDSTTYLNSGPMFHIGSLRRTLAVLHAGGRNVMCRRVDAETLCELVATERCTDAFLQKPTMSQMVDVNRDGRYDLSSLRSRGGPEGWADMVTFSERDVVRSGYGQTELAGVVTFDYPGRPGVGSWPGPLALVDVRTVDGTTVARGQIGEIVVRGPMVMNGYYRRDTINTNRIRDGWYHTNDLGRLESDGSISFVGPSERIVKTANENVYPIEVENGLREHPDVADVGVLGIPDQEWGQRLKAVVVRREGSSVSADALLAFARTTLAGYKCPRLYEFVDAVPAASGHVDRDALDVRYGGGGYPGTS